MSNLLEQLTRECKFAWRRIRSAPGPTVFAILTLAVGIGISVATYSVVYTALWRPLGVQDEDRIALMGRTTSLYQRSGQFTWESYQELLREQRGFQGVAAWTQFGTVLASEGTAELVRGEAVTGSYFPMLGVKPALGRVLGPDDDRPGAFVVVISDPTWRTQFNADSGIIGKTIKLADHPFEIVGVAPPGFRGVNPDGFVVRAAWVPIAAYSQIDRWLSRAMAPAVSDPRTGSTFTIGFRPPANQSMKDAADAINAMGLRLDASNPLPPYNVAGAGPQPSFRYWTARPVSDDQSINSQDQLGRIIVGLPALVLLIACTNIANLVLSRGAARRHDFGVRRALGASRWRLIREQLVEQTAIVLVGGVLGVSAAYGLVRWLAGLARGTIAPFVRGLQFDWSLDAGVLSSAGVAVLLSIVVAGLIPALHLTRDSMRTVLDQGGNAATPKWRGRANLVALQVGVSVGLFLIAMIFVKMLILDPSLARGLVTMTPGSDRVAVATIPFEAQHRDQTRTTATVDNILKALRQSPDVAAAAVASEQPFGRFVSVYNDLRGDIVRPAWMPPNPVSKTIDTAIDGVSPEYFTAVGTPLVHGRPFADTDTHESAPVVIVNEGLVRDLFGSSEPLGRHVTLQLRERPGTPAQAVDVEIVGVSASEPMIDRRTGRPYNVHQIYVPYAQQPVLSVAILARAAGNLPGPVEGLRAAIKKVDPELAVAALGRADVLERGPLAFLGYLATILSTLSFLALGMAMAGLYGVLSHVVARRSREMGIRIAIGATAARIVRLVLHDGFRPILEGLFIGLATATVVRLFLKFSLRADNIAPVDPLAFILAAVLVTGAGALACYLPARRAARVDPNVALRNL